MRSLGKTIKLSQGLHLSYSVRCSPADQRVKGSLGIGACLPYLRKSKEGSDEEQRGGGESCRR